MPGLPLGTTSLYSNSWGPACRMCPMRSSVLKALTPMVENCGNYPIKRVKQPQHTSFMCTGIKRRRRHSTQRNEAGSLPGLSTLS